MINLFVFFFFADDLLGLVHVPITSVNAQMTEPKWYWH